MAGNLVERLVALKEKNLAACSVASKVVHLVVTTAENSAASRAYLLVALKAEKMVDKRVGKKANLLVVLMARPWDGRSAAA